MFTAADRSPNGYREYGRSQVARVADIEPLLSLGLTAADIRAFLPCLGDAIADGPVCPASAAVIARRLADVDDRIAALAAARARLVDALTRAGAGELARPHEPPGARTTG
ncbi:MerR family DNA-binding protein [Streptomyces sp. PT12]|uniref:MerR family DNA-binding protein n=1 Tax=Streptomyces sp. PT12 TaxID=1510197 RepID=UPI000DE387F0|nr:MerR family DNA-binding protein [Streptomyces sp. PT12]RBM23349.1 MerR family transcriptional regulator [Streptomyces sp. PT12]